MKNLTKIYKQIPSTDIEKFGGWYKEAHQFAEHLSNTYKVSFDKVCGVISALSPACQWDANKADAEKLIGCFYNGEDFTQIPFRTYGQNVAKAWQIIIEDGKEVKEYFNLKTGAKTYNFYFNILEPENKDYVTIDRHAIAIIEGRFGVPSGSKNLTPKQYNIIADSYKKLAKKLGLLPNELQAILWEFHVRTINLN